MSAISSHKKASAIDKATTFIENVDAFWQPLSDWTKRVSHV